MASSKSRTFTFHVAPHFNIAADGGALRLGTVVTDLLDLAPLNRNEADYKPVSDADVYPPTSQVGFAATRTQLLSGDFGIWTKALGRGGVGGSVNSHGERHREETFSCDNIVTTYFDPTADWVNKCLSAKPVNDYIVGSGYKKEVYIITGLKVATNLTFGNEAVRKINGKAEAEAKGPQALVTVGIAANAGHEKSQMFKFQSTDIVVGFRVKGYRYKKKSLFGKERKLEGRPFNKGAEMLGDKAGPFKVLDQFEEVPIPEEVSAQIQEVPEGNEGSVQEYWVE
jgi:hypothetical protein